MRNSTRIRHRYPPLVSGIPASASWVLLIMLALVVIVPFSSLSKAPVAELKPIAAPIPEQVEARIVAKGYDKHHRPLAFTVYVLTHELSWKVESATDLEGTQPLLSPELIAAINAAPDVFCIGTASAEGLIEAEEARAAQRARTLAQWVKAVIRDRTYTRLFSLNAGQYNGPRELASASQRKAIIIVTGPHDKDVNLTEGLRSGLEQQKETHPALYGLLHHYSRSDNWLNFSNDAVKEARRWPKRSSARR